VSLQTGGLKMFVPWSIRISVLCPWTIYLLKINLLGYNYLDTFWIPSLYLHLLYSYKSIFLVFLKKKSLAYFRGRVHSNSRRNPFTIFEVEFTVITEEIIKQKPSLMPLVS